MVASLRIDQWLYNCRGGPPCLRAIALQVRERGRPIWEPTEGLPYNSQNPIPNPVRNYFFFVSNALNFGPVSGHFARMSFQPSS
jgi:hypothetical protein